MPFRNTIEWAMWLQLVCVSRLCPQRYTYLGLTFFRKYFFRVKIVQLLRMQKSHLASKVFAMIVPITVVAFYLGMWSLPSSVVLHGFGDHIAFQYVAILLSFVGVFTYNWFEES